MESWNEEWMTFLQRFMGNVRVIAQAIPSERLRMKPFGSHALDHRRQGHI